MHLTSSLVLWGRSLSKFMPKRMRSGNLLASEFKLFGVLFSPGLPYCTVIGTNDCEE